MREFLVHNMRCAGCAKSVEKRVSALHDAEKVYVNFAAGRLTLEADPAKLTDAEIIAAVTVAGFRAEVPPEDPAELIQREKNAAKKERKRLAICLFFTILVTLFSFLPLPAAAEKCRGIGQMLLFLPVLWGGFRFFRFGIPALLRGRPDMDSLIACGAGAGVLDSLFLMFTSPGAHLHWQASAMILSFVMGGKFLEVKARRRASGAIRELLRLHAETATLLPETGGEKEVPASSLRPGDRVLVRPGETFPADGVIQKGSADVNEAMLSGEELPVSRTTGDPVAGGTVNLTGYLTVQITGTGEKSLLGRIVRMVSEAQGSRPPVAALADRVSGVFTWFIFSSALLTGALWLASGASWEKALGFSLAVLVTACPCALGLATPIALISGIGRGAASGILFRNGEALERCAKINTVVFDKTGTLTEGKPQLLATFLFPGSGLDESSFLSVAAAVESGSGHPLAAAVATAAQKTGISTPPAVAGHTLFPGFGVSAQVENEPWLFGNAAFLRSRGVVLPELPPDCAENTVILGARGQEAIGGFTFGDSIRHEAPACVETLRRSGIRILMLTGDHGGAAERTAEKLRLDGFLADIRPEEKAMKIRELQQSAASPAPVIAMAGDGINDAPALAQADVGIAIGSATAAAMESADIVLLRSDLNELPNALALSKAVMRVIRQNLFWAFFYNFCGLPLAAGALWKAGIPALDPAFCAGAMALSSLTVVTNALRLLRWRGKGDAGAGAKPQKSTGF